MIYVHINLARTFYHPATVSVSIDALVFSNNWKTGKFQWIFQEYNLGDQKVTIAFITACSGFLASRFKDKIICLCNRPLECRKIYLLIYVYICTEELETWKNKIGFQIC